MDVKAVDFCLPNQNNEEICLSNFLGKWVVLYFYPKDNTKACTLEAIDFTDNLGQFEGLNASIIGISPDSIRSHQNFMKKHDLKITLLSDPEHKIIEEYGVWQKKKMYGREYYGVVRSTFIIDDKGYIKNSWRKVRVKGHVEEVKQKLTELQRQQ
jgi:peroxiredoxin Q/BCP